MPELQISMVCSGIFSISRMKLLQCRRFKYRHRASSMSTRRAKTSTRSFARPEVPSTMSFASMSSPDASMGHQRTEIQSLFVWYHLRLQSKSHADNAEMLSLLRCRYSLMSAGIAIQQAGGSRASPSFLNFWNGRKRVRR